MPNATPNLLISYQKKIIKTDKGHAVKMDFTGARLQFEGSPEQMLRQVEWLETRLNLAKTVLRTYASGNIPQSSFKIPFQVVHIEMGEVPYEEPTEG